MILFFFSNNVFVNFHLEIFFLDQVNVFAHFRYTVVCCPLDA